MLHTGRSACIHEKPLITPVFQLQSDCGCIFRYIEVRNKMHPKSFTLSFCQTRYTLAPNYGFELSLVLETFKNSSAERVLSECRPVPIYCRCISKRYIYSRSRYIAEISQMYHLVAICWISPNCVDWGKREYLTVLLKHTHRFKV